METLVLDPARVIVLRGSDVETASDFIDIAGGETVSVHILAFYEYGATAHTMLVTFPRHFASEVLDRSCARWQFWLRDENPSNFRQELPIWAHLLVLQAFQDEDEKAKGSDGITLCFF